MDTIELNERERSLVCNVLGYLNFSSGNFDAQFAGTWNDLYRELSARRYSELWKESIKALDAELRDLEKQGGAFSDSAQAKRVLEVLTTSLNEYLVFHTDSLFSLKASYLYNSLFMAKICRVVVASVVSSEPSTKANSLASDVVREINDFLGYRPIPVLEDGEKHEPNEKEWVAPIPLFLEGAGTAFGQYESVISLAIDILRDTSPAILRDASFMPEKLRELAVDPRAYDFDHPVHRRLNYSFGTWDERSMDQDGYFRRFVVHRATLDAIMSRVWTEKDEALIPLRNYESAAVLAGTMLMASGVSGGRVQAHDSNVTLGSLTGIVARYRDLFYRQLLAKAPTPFKSILEEENNRLFQPFAGVRQYLNQYLAQKRADQFQRFSLARTYARMGYFEASKRQTNAIETPSSRLLSEIDCLITKAHLEADAGKIKEASERPSQIKALLHRGLACGAFPDPWFILGFDSQFNLFPSIENGIHDHRLDGLVDLLNDVFDLYSRLQKEAAAQGDAELRLELSDQMSELADWWDQFGSSEVSSIEGFSGQAAWESAAEVSRALAVWNQAGKAIGDVAFWKRHVERFTTPKAFVLLCEALLDKNDLVSSSSLLIYWLNQSENIPLVEGDYSFHSVAFDWMEQVWNPIETIDSASQRLRKKATFAEVNWSREDYLHRWNQTIKFLDYFGENAGSQWEVPTIELPKEKFDRKLDFKTDNTVIADLSRRLVLATKYLGKTPLGTPKISLKASFRDAARAVDFRHILSPGEFRKFYSDNRKVFPNFLTFNIFMQILLNELRMPPKMLAYYKRAIFGNDIGSISLSVPGFISSRSRTFQANSSDPNESDNVEKRLLNDLAKELGKDDSTGEAQDLIDRILREQENINAEETRETERRGLASIERIEDDFGDYPDENEYGEDEDEEVSNEENSERTITGGDSTFSAAYENMSYRDTADDGIDDITADGKSSFDDQGDDFEFARETDRVTERLAFIYSTVKLWKFATCRCPLLTTLSTGSFDDATFSDARLRLEDWRDQAIKFKNDLEVLLDQTSRYRVPQPSGTNESLAEYDQLRGSKEILLDRIVWTIVEVEDAIVFLKSALRDESVERYAKSWKSLALQTFGAMFRGDVKLVQHLWPDLTSKLEKETLLYIPTSRGGDAKSIVECRFLQQVVLCLLKFAPRLGLLQETFRLIECVQKMEQIRLSTPGSITEYDRLVETAARGVTETLAESAKSWRTESGQSLAPSRDETLIYYLTEASDVILKFWLSHSQQIRISSVEAIATNSRWKVVKEFVQKYGSDLFTQEFLAFRNIRAILHQGAQNYLSSLIAMKRDNQDLENGEKIVSAILDGSENLDNVAGILETILECVAENYTTYVDYNTTTTQSDRGEMLYVLLDFLRVIASYERIYWNLKPVYWIHDSLIRAELHKAAELWKKRVREKSSGLAESSLREYDALKKRYGVALQSVHDRLRERFVRPLDIAQMCGLVYDAISEVRKCGENNPVFQELEKEVESFAATPSGVGFEAPEWLTLLQDEVVLSRVDAKEERRENETKEDPFESVAFISIKKMSCEEIETQLCAALRNVGIGSGGHF